MTRGGIRRRKSGENKDQGNIGHTTYLTGRDKREMAARTPQWFTVSTTPYAVRSKLVCGIPEEKLVRTGNQSCRVVSPFFNKGDLK